MLQPSDTSYFSVPAAGLDPRLFRNGKLDSSVRSAILQLLLNHLNGLYTGAERWMAAFLTGSGISYQWAANREPGDLDCLVNIDYNSFRQSNDNFRGLSNKEIADELNEGFRSLLHPKTEMFLGTFELTFFATTVYRIQDIKPYAAYSVTNDVWVVPPTHEGQQIVEEWEPAIERDRQAAIEIMTRFIASRNQYDQATNDAVKTNASSQMRVAASQGNALYEDIHGNRSLAFSPTGQGYADFNNYRWQSGKKTGVIQALRGMRSEMEERDATALQKTYGVTEFPDTNTLIRRAATYQK